MKFPRVWRFSLATLLLLLTTAGVWLSAYRHGYRAGDASWRYDDEYTQAYSVHDLVSPDPQHPIVIGVNSPPTFKAWAEAKPLLTALEVALTTGDQELPRIVFYPNNLSVIVTGTGRAHRSVSEILRQLRAEPPKWQILVTGDEEWIPAGAVVYRERS